MKCVVAGCSQTFCVYSTFSSHLSRKHCGVDFESEARLTIISCNNCTRESEEVNELGSGDISINTEFEVMDIGTPGETEPASSIPDGSILQMQACTEGSNRLSRFAALLY